MQRLLNIRYILPALVTSTQYQLQRAHDEW
jgi:hypothetical protein